MRVGDALSDIFRLENGTAQGSIISPLLFLIMTNDQPDVLVNVESSLFADDSAVFKSGQKLKIYNTANLKNLDRLGKWCDTWGFKVSMDKTIEVLFTRRIGENNIKLIFNGKHLGK